MKQKQWIFVMLALVLSAGLLFGCSGGGTPADSTPTNSTPTGNTPTAGMEAPSTPAPPPAETEAPAPTAFTLAELDGFWYRDAGYPVEGVGIEIFSIDAASGLWHYYNSSGYGEEGGTAHINADGALEMSFIVSPAIFYIQDADTLVDETGRTLFNKGEPMVQPEAPQLVGLWYRNGDPSMDYYLLEEDGYYAHYFTFGDELHLNREGTYSYRVQPVEHIAGDGSSTMVEERQIRFIIDMEDLNYENKAYLSEDGNSFETDDWSPVTYTRIDTDSGA